MLFLLIALLALVLQFFLPWWIIALVAFGLAFLTARNGMHAFGHGFLAILALWIIMGLIHSFPNEHILANRVGQMLMLPDNSWNWALVLVITGIVGGLASGFSALAGFYCRQALVKS